MKKGLWILVLLCTSMALKAQTFAIINDPHGYVNVKQGKGPSGKIIGKIFKDQLFVSNIDYQPKKDKWIVVSVDKGSIINYLSLSESQAKQPHLLMGYIPRSRIFSITRLPPLKTRRLSDQKIVIQNDSIYLSISKSGFARSEHKIDYVKEPNCITCASFVYQIDGKRPYGVDAELPQTQINDITLMIKKVRVNIPAESYADLYQPGLKYMNVYIGSEGTIYLYLLQSSDGAGAYSAIWVIKNKKLIERYVDNSND